MPSREFKTLLKLKSAGARKRVADVASVLSLRHLTAVEARIG